MFHGKRTSIVSAVPTITAQAYSAGKQLGGVTKIPSAVPLSGSGANLLSLAIIDAANQKSAIDILFFNQAPTLISVDGGTFDISDAEMVSKYLGRIAVPNTNYKTNGSSTNADVAIANINLKVQSIANSLDIYFVLVCQGTPTYVSTTDLALKFGFDQD